VVKNSMRFASSGVGSTSGRLIRIALLHIFETHNVHLQFATERERLEKQWDRGENVNTEDLRQAFKRYRAFFDRLLTV
jgi:hypothetical protein